MRCPSSHLYLDQTRMSHKQIQPIEDLKPCVPSYGPISCRDLAPGQQYSWCRCGLSTSQPWCNDACSGTGLTPLIWTCESSLGDQQSFYSICNCKYTLDPPFCDARHTSLPLDYLRQIEECARDHSRVGKICTSCGFKPDSK